MGIIFCMVFGINKDLLNESDFSFYGSKIGFILICFDDSYFKYYKFIF